MKKITIFLIFVVIIVGIVGFMYLNYINNINGIKNENKIYEAYLNEEKKGTQIATLINKAMDTNYKNNVTKDKNGKYQNNNENSINIDFKFIDHDKTYCMETIFTNGVSTFTSYYGEIKFKCTKIEYHFNGRVKYLLFEQATK